MLVHGNVISRMYIPLVGSGKVLFKIISKRFGRGFCFNFKVRRRSDSKAELEVFGRAASIWESCKHLGFFQAEITFPPC